MISSRYAPAVCLLSALALVPVILHGYVGALALDDLSVTSIPMKLAGYSARDIGRDPEWGRLNFDSDAWFRRAYVRGREEIVLTAVRSFDAKRLYHHPELAAAYGITFDRREVSRLGGPPPLPIHVLRPFEGARGFAVYALIYDGRLIERPILFQLRTAGELLFSKRRQMTLLFAHQAASVPGLDVEQQPSTQLLLEAIGAFMRPAQTAPPKS